MMQSAKKGRVGAALLFILLTAATAALLLVAQSRQQKKAIFLPSSKVLMSPVPGDTQATNSFPVSIALSNDGRYLAILNNGYGTLESGVRQSISVLDLNTNQLVDFPDPRLGKKARQTYFLGMAFSSDGRRIYASLGSLTDPSAELEGSTGNGIAVYRFEAGRIAPDRFIPIPLQQLAPGKRSGNLSINIPEDKAIPFPAGLAVIAKEKSDVLLVAGNYSDSALLLDTGSGQILHRFDVSTRDEIPSAYPYAVLATRDGRRAYCSLWNASQIAELDLKSRKVSRWIALPGQESRIAAGPHPTAMLLSPDEKLLYVTLSNEDKVAVVETATGKPIAFLSTLLPGQKYGGTFPNALAQRERGSKIARLFVANASSNAVAVFNVSKIGARKSVPAGTLPALGFIPTEWYPTALAVRGDDLLIATGKGQGTGPNSAPLPKTFREDEQPTGHPYVGLLIRGSLARVNIPGALGQLAELTAEVEESNVMSGSSGLIPFRGGKNPIRHVIYIIKENRTYDQLFGDLKEANGDPSLVMYGEDITPNHHKLTRQFGILDNFYDSGEVSGDGHVWTDAAITSDYTEKTWQIAYRGKERAYDYGGMVSNDYPLEQGQPDVNEPATGFLWANAARHGVSYRHYSEYISTVWCNVAQKVRRPSTDAKGCARKVVRKGEPLPGNVGQPRGSASPWPWPVPLFSRNVATKPELRGHFDPNFPNFNTSYPDQLRADEFLNEFEQFVRARVQGKSSDAQLPALVVLQLPDDHTAGTRRGSPRPAASVADNDLALGRVVEAVSHSPYWDDTAILVIEDDAQNGADHVDAHRSPALVISKYSPSLPQRPFVDHHFYTTVNMVRTLEVLLGLPPMNNNDAQAEVMAPLFSGAGNQTPYTADFSNRENGLIYQMNITGTIEEEESAKMDFSRPDAVDAAVLNQILWRDRKGNQLMPPPKHTVIHP